MKTLIVTLALAVAGVSTAHAQYRPSNAGPGAVIGGIAGAIIGGHNNDRWGEGAAIGAAAGALIGAATDQPYGYSAGYAGDYRGSYDPCVEYPQSRRVVVVNRYPPVRYVSAPPVRRVVYSHRYAPRAPVVVIRSHDSHRRHGDDHRRQGDDHGRSRHDRRR